MAYPFENLSELGWRPVDGKPGSVSRPVSGAELVLDQVRRLNDGMNDLCSGILISHSLSCDTFEERLREAWLRLRYCSPLIAAEILRDEDPDKLGKWLYTPVDLRQAGEWCSKTLHFVRLQVGQLTGEFIECFIQKTISASLPHDGKGGHLFHGYILMEGGDRAVILLHASHTILDGPALTDCLHVLMETIIHPERSEDSSALKWGSEGVNLPPHPLEIFGGPLDGWETDGIALLKEMDMVLGGNKGSHTLVPQRTEAEDPNMTRKVSHLFGQDETKHILAAVKANGSTVTVLLEAAHVLATLSLHPPSHRDGRTVLFPSIVALRHLMKPPWNNRNTLVVTGAAVPIVATHSTILDDQNSTSERERLLVLMKDFNAQYKRWLSSSHHVFIVPAQSAIKPIRNAISGGDAEITNLGVLERKMTVEWQAGSEGERLAVEDFFLGLRRTAPVLMTHSWTLKDRLHVQCQGNDTWDADFMQRFLNEMIRFVHVIVES